MTPAELQSRILKSMRRRVAYSFLEVLALAPVRGEVRVRYALNQLIECGEVLREKRARYHVYLLPDDGVDDELDIVQPRVVDLLNRPAYRPGPEWRGIDEKLAEYRRIPSRGV